jgi:nitroreductase/FMN reductase (NADPH)/FMN reductase [NAD(P)H]
MPLKRPAPGPYIESDQKRRCETIMNKTIQELTDRKSVRAFTEQPIDQETKKVIIQAAMEAPTAGNQQLYTILDITDQKLKERLAETCDHQPFIARAQMVLIFCADCQKWYDAYEAGGCNPRKPGAGDLMLAVTDAAIAAQNAVTAAESLGIGSCYIGDIMERCEIHRELLHLPDYVFPAAMLVFGYPTDQQKQRPKPGRRDQKYIVRENGYYRMTDPELRAMLEDQSGKQGFENWIRAFCNRKYNSDFSVEMSRSVGEYLKSFSEY